MAAYGVARGFELAIFGGEGRIGGEIALESERVRGVQFAVEGGIQPEELADRGRNRSWFGLQDFCERAAGPRQA